MKKKYWLIIIIATILIALEIFGFRTIYHLSYFLGWVIGKIVNLFI